MSIINKTVIMSDANHFGVEKPINPYYHQDSVNFDNAKKEHDSIYKLFVDLGLKVIKVPSPTACQDGVYTANWALVRGNKAVMSNLPNARKHEELYAKKLMKSLGKEIIEIPKELKFSGQGDALACGNLLFCGSGYRSDEEAQIIATKALGYQRIQLKAKPQLNKKGLPVINKSSGWPDSFFYDLDLALAIIKPPIDDKKGLIAYCPEAFCTESRKLLQELDCVEKIKVSIDEAKKGFATNLVSTGETVIMSSHAPKLVKKLIKHGLKVVTPKITELAKGGGFIRCITLTID